MASSSSATGLNRTRSLRQPTAGLGSVPKKDGARKDEARTALEMRSRSAVAAASPAASTSASTNDTARNMSPSKLPKPGALTAAVRTRAGPSGLGSNTATRLVSGTRSRPNSGIFGLSQPETTAARPPPTQSLVRAGAEPPKGTRRIPTSSSRLTRPKSMIVPSAPSQSLATSSVRPSSSTSTSLASPSTAKPQPQMTAHTRGKSTATSMTASRPPRPPSAGSADSASTTATAASRRPLKQVNTVNTRTAQQRQAPSSSVANTSILSTTSSMTATRSLKKTLADDTHRVRPAFNTLQQHFSPARNLAPKPLTSSYLAPPTPSKLPANVALSSETAKLQTELLQLHLLHRDADAVTTSWHASARERLGRRFEDLAQADTDAGKEEVAEEEARNLAALKSWASTGGGKTIDNNIQTLDGVLTGLWILGEPGGRYARVVRKFEKWSAQMTSAVEARRHAGGLGALMNGDEVAFISELDLAWKEEVSSLARSLDRWRRHLAHLEDGLPDQSGEEMQTSSLVRIVAGCRNQVHGMLAELDMMGQIETLAFSHEAAWIRRMNRQDTADDTPVAGAIWRAF